MQRQIENAIDAGDGDAVARQLREQMASNPDILEVRLKLAEHYRRMGFPELAVEHYRLCVERFPEQPKVVLLLAQTLHEQGMTRRAADELDRFLAKHPPSSPDSPAWLGIFRDELGDYAAAESAHRAALSLNPSNARLLNNLGYNLLLQEKTDDAIAHFRRALALDPRMETARNNLGLALARNPGPEAERLALEQWQSAAGPATAHNNLAAVLIEQGRFGEARKQLETALTLKKDHAPALKNLALLSSLDGQPAALPQPAAPKPGGWKRFMKKVWYSVAGIEQSSRPQQQGLTAVK
ncbi:MAG: tetratricopeptide repeat protein [Acidobacteria bacterium]|nr:tetratricopeptide repeat protein [Acidobacteriota bacterium]